MQRIYAAFSVTWTDGRRILLLVCEMRIIVGDESENEIYTFAGNYSFFKKKKCTHDHTLIVENMLLMVYVWYYYGGFRCASYQWELTIMYLFEHVFEKSKMFIAFVVYMSAFDVKSRGNSYQRISENCGSNILLAWMYVPQAFFSEHHFLTTLAKSGRCVWIYFQCLTSAIPKKT